MKPRRALGQRVRRRASVRPPILTWRIDAENLSEWQVLPHIAELSEVVIHGFARSLSR